MAFLLTKILQNSNTYTVCQLICNSLKIINFLKHQKHYTLRTIISIMQYLHYLLISIALKFIELQTIMCYLYYRLQQNKPHTTLQ